MVPFNKVEDLPAHAVPEDCEIVALPRHDPFPGGRPPEDL